MEALGGSPAPPESPVKIGWELPLNKMAVAVSMPNFDKAIEYKADKVITDRSDKEYFKPGEYDSAKYVRFEGEQRGKAVAYKLQTQGRVASRADLEPEVYKAIKAKCGVDYVKGGHLSNAFDCKGLGWARQRLGATGGRRSWLCIHARS